MADLIERSKLMMKLRYTGEGSHDFVINKVRDMVRNAPPIEAEPVVHARWEEYSKVLGFLRCSHCKDCYVDKDWPKGSKWKYCPHCGAKMDEEETDGKV